MVVFDAVQRLAPCATGRRPCGCCEPGPPMARRGRGPGTLRFKPVAAKERAPPVLPLPALLQNGASTVPGPCSARGADGIPHVGCAGTRARGKRRMGWDGAG
ncbi:hypothetical protein CTA1_10774 [Colletotrichum tanaceti]|uniref:Uncharacterized protein n=1 Tax=Colletotrichum tanaceti TaxID=1306861 RepID=A0A4U6XFM1_9PEZI|nr:hypothetical protein CTA1_10774 [Colletotrichum tanaceti]